MIKLKINNKELSVDDGVTVAAAILMNEIKAFRNSVTGQPRAPLCGMGVCFECRVTIDGVKHQRSCTTIVEEGLEIITGE